MARKSQPVKKPTAKQTAAQKRQTQNRREIWALVCIFLAIFSIICCFNTTAFLIKPFASLIAGLFGQAGRYILPLALIATVVILFTSRGKPVRLRIVSVFTLILTVSAVYHLIQGEALVWEWKVVPALFKGGIAGTTGGLLGGLLEDGNHRRRRVYRPDPCDARADHHHHEYDGQQHHHGYQEPPAPAEARRGAGARAGHGRTHRQPCGQPPYRPRGKAPCGGI